MNDREFLDVIIHWATSLKQAPLTSFEKDQIVKEFNTSSGSNFERAQEAVNNVIRRRLTEDILSKSANLDNTKRLLDDVRSAASQWKPESKK